MDQLKKIWPSLSLFQRLTIGVVLLAAGGAVMWLTSWKHESNFKPLYRGLASEDAAEALQKLKENNVEFRLEDDGGTILVPAEKLAETRLILAREGLPKTGRIGFELFDKSNFGATEFVEHINYKRAMEGELERSIMSLSEVEQARVHLTLSKDSVFLDQQQPAKASVMVKLRPGAEISPQNVLAVTNLVASAVEGLTPDAVTVVDMDGALLSRPKKGAVANANEITSESLEMRSAIEKNLVAKINETLEPLLGSKSFRAGASVDYDMTSTEQQEETLDPARSVMTSSQKTEDVTERANSAGVPGTASNLPNPSPTSKGQTGVSRRTENVNYQTSRVVRHTRIPQGIIRRMSLAVLVDQSVRWEGDGAAKHRVLIPPPPETLKTIRDLVAGVSGFSADRGDQLVVETLPFESSLNSEPPKSLKPVNGKPGAKDPAWLEFIKNYRDLAIPLVVGLALLVVLVHGIIRMTRRVPAPKIPDMHDELASPAAHAQLSAAAEMAANGQLTAAQAAQLAAGEPATVADRVRMMSKRDPVVTANILRGWMQESRS